MRVGRLDEDTGRVTCGKKYLENHPELVGKELFYEYNKLVERTLAQQELNGPVNSCFPYRCEAISFGLTYAYWEIGRKNKMLSDLLDVFGENGAELLRLCYTQSSYKGRLLTHILAQSLRMMMSVSATGKQTKDSKLPGDSLNKLMFELQTLQACRPTGQGDWIVNDFSKKTSALFDLLGVDYPKKLVKD